jgi:hypothetical protein
MFSNFIICVCDKSVKHEDAIGVSGYGDKWDLRTKQIKYYCRSCLDGKRIALEWLMKDHIPKEDNGK